MPVDAQGAAGRVIRPVTVALLTLLATGFGRPLVAQHTLRGQVVDTAGTILAGVEIVLAEAGRRGVTDSGGRYTVSDIPTGRYEVVFRRLGYAPVTMFRSFMGDTGTTTVTVELRQEAVVLPEVETKARGPAEVPVKLQGWARRRQFNGGGKFWDDSLMRTLEYRRLADVLQPVSGARILLERGERHLVTFEGRAGVTRGRPCYVVVYLDGARLSTPMNLDDLPVHNLAAMEFYRSASEMPVEFNSPGSMCGVLALWTR